MRDAADTALLTAILASPDLSERDRSFCGKMAAGRFALSEPQRFWVLRVGWRLRLPGVERPKPPDSLLAKWNHRRRRAS